MLISIFFKLNNHFQAIKRLTCNILDSSIIFLVLKMPNKPKALLVVPLGQTSARFSG